MILCTLEEEIATLIETEMLHSNNDNPIFISHPLNTPTKNQLLSITKKAKKAQKLMKPRKTHHQVTIFRLMKIHELS